MQDLIDNGMLDEPLDGNHGGIHPKASDYVDSGIPFIMASDLHEGKIDYTTCKYITQAQANNLRKGFARAGDVLLTHKATLGRTAVVDNTHDYVVLTPQVTYYRAKTGLSNRYLKYYFDSDEFQTTLHNWGASGSTRSYLGITAQKKLPVILPPLEEQEVIAGTLSALDDKIAVNTKINRHLEQMAQAVFKSWFVDFEPSIPFTKVIQVLGGGTPKTGNAEYWNGDIPFFTPKDVLDTYVLATEKTLTETGLSNCSSRLYPINTVFVTARGTVGKLAIAGRPMAMNQSCYALVGKEGHGQYFVYHLAQYVVENLKHKASGAVFDAIVTRDFESELVPDIQTDEICSFEKTVTGIYQAIFNNTNENAHLAALRDALLPRLISGKLPPPVG